MTGEEYYVEIQSVPGGEVRVRLYVRDRVFEKVVEEGDVMACVELISTLTSSDDWFCAALEIFPELSEFLPDE